MGNGRAPSQPKNPPKSTKEIINTIGTHQQVKESDTDDLPYLHAIIKETLRLHPACPLLLPYNAQNDCEILNYTIPKNTQVFVNVWAIGRDPDYWESPSDFIPERFLNSSVDFKSRNFEYIAFGAGRRICSGLPLAIRMVHLMLASILQSFDWKLPEGVKPEILDMGDGRAICGHNEENYSSCDYSYCKVDWGARILEKL